MKKYFLQTMKRRRLSMIILLLLIALCIPLHGQNVTVSEKTGSMICSQTSYAGQVTETGFAAGGFATWKHFQLPLTMTTADLTSLTSNGQLATHANNLYNAGIGKGIQLLGGKRRDGYMTLALPKGFRFTGYKIIVQNNITEFGTGNKALTISHPTNFYFGETSNNFDFKAGYYKDLGKNVSQTEYTIERTSQSEGDMGNVLYFKVANDPSNHPPGQYVGVTLKYIELTFTPEAKFTVSVAPSAASSVGVSHVSCPFATGKVDLGKISKNTYTDVTRQSYVYTNVKDLSANALFYEKASVNEGLAIDNRTVGSAEGNKSIKAVERGAGRFFEIQEGQTYFVETPIDAIDQERNKVPLHYRITAAKINYMPNSGSGRSTYVPYTLKVYDKTGKVAKEIVVKAAGSYEMTDLNNDAIKLEVVGANGFVNIDLTLEALDPYINHMELMCNHGEAKISREFVSNDFSVGGGVFYFYIPREWLNTFCNFTFENLKSKYGDNTYYGGITNGNARYSFVKSEYYNLFGATNNNIYNRPEDAANYDYTKKVYVETAGTKAFKFNNADEVNQATSATSFKEYPFSLESYAAGGGAFSTVQMKPDIENHDYKKNAFVFTTDETRYNIAPTTATQHRYYAYYDMEIHLVVRAYTPSVTFEKIYDKSFYGNSESGPFYGATITSKDAEGHLGYSSIESIKTLLETNIATGGTNIPTSMEQLLYLDMGSKMEGTFSVAADTWRSLKQALAKNAMIFLPKNTTREDDNFAYAEEGGTYKATRNIILTDKQPFYSPYKIRVDAANYAKYIRELSGGNGQARKTTLMLPFALTLTNGKHTNKDNDCSFEIYTLQPTNCLTVSPEQREGYDYLKFDGDAHFIKLTESKTTANKPYMVLVDEGYMPADGQSFIVQQYGAEIIPTTAHKNRTYLAGETATGTANGTSFRFENRGTYCGEKVQKVFYFANNKYYSSLNLTTDPKEVRVRPFRAYYAFNSSRGAEMASFNVVFGPNTETTAIANIKNQSDLAVTTSDGQITLYAKTAQQVKIFKATGGQVVALQLNAGAVYTLPVAAGVYVINGVKITVK